MRKRKTAGENEKKSDSFCGNNTRSRQSKGGHYRTKKEREQIEPKNTASSRPNYGGR